MKKLIPILSLAALALGVLPAGAQFGAGGGGPQFDGAMAKLFGDNQAFSATMEFQTIEPSSGKTMTMPGKFSMDAGKTRFELNIADIQGGRMPANAGAQLKAMGMDNMVTIARPDKGLTYLIYPGMQSYTQTPLKNPTSTNPDDFKATVTEIGKETVDGHDCIKNKVVVTGKDGTPHESTMWNAIDLKKFPIKIEMDENGQKTSISYKNVSMAKPDASIFEAPSDYTKYASVQAMMQQVMMKRMGSMPQ